MCRRDPRVRTRSGAEDWIIAGDREDVDLVAAVGASLHGRVEGDVKLEDGGLPSPKGLHDGVSHQRHVFRRIDPQGASNPASTPTRMPSSSPKPSTQRSALASESGKRSPGGGQTRGLQFQLHSSLLGQRSQEPSELAFA